MDINWEVLFRLFLAMLFGGVIGYERESAHRPAGLRTNLLVCLGAALIVLFESFYHEMNPGTTDNLRMAAQVVTGIGFLGAGTIIQTRSHVIGLTTAATLWVTAGIGMAIGGGFYYAAGASLIFVLLSLRLLKLLENHLTVKNGRVLMIAGESKGDFAKKLQESLSKLKIPVWDMKISVDSRCFVEASLRIPGNIDIDLLIAELMKIEGVHKVTTELMLE
jgi:putative Mg2+ transporter-C (MgtC) family protein